MRSLMEALNHEHKLRTEKDGKNPSVMIRTKANATVRAGTFELVEVLTDGLRLRTRLGRDDATFLVSRDQIAEAQLV